VRGVGFLSGEPVARRAEATSGVVRVPPVADVVGELFSHVFLFGIVIALAVARATATEVRRPSGIS